ncbi:hypothetical protein Tco_0138492 [Tanacetum coccineum]
MQQEKLDTVSYHKLFDILKQYQNESNEIRAEKLAKNANPLALVAAAQHYPEYHNQAPKPHKPHVPSSRQITSSKSHATTKSKDDNDEEPDEQELEAHYMYMAKIQEVLTAESGPSFDAEPLEQVHIEDDYNVFANERQHSEQPESINDTYVVEKFDSNVIPDSSDMCDNEGKADQHAEEYEAERVMLANLIENLKLDTDEKKIQNKKKKANTSRAYELKE